MDRRSAGVSDEASSPDAANKAPVVPQRRLRSALRNIVADVFSHATGRPMDKRLGVDTSASAGSDRSGNPEYLPVPARVFWLSVSTLPIDFARFAFVDLSAGKGRAVVLAGELPFQEVHGVEPVKALHVRAVQNVKARFGGEIGRVRIFLHDVHASDYEIPDLPCVLYVAKPFSTGELPRVIEAVQRSHRRNTREIFLIDAGSGDEHTFDTALFEKVEWPWWQRAVDRVLVAPFRVYTVRNG